MPISIPAPTTPVGQGRRSIGSVILDDAVSSFVQEINFPSTREVQMERIINRHGRMTRVKEDDGPLVADVRGIYVDGAAAGAYYRDFKAALLGQSRAPFTLGDGTRLEMVDVMGLTQKAVASSLAWTATPAVVTAWTFKAHSYEPFAREVAPVMQSLGALTTGSGTFSTSFSVSCLGTAFSEPTWQFKFTVPPGVVVTGLGIQNTTSGESISMPTPIFPADPQPQYVIVDASGAKAPAVGQPASSPNNNGYSLLYGNGSVGYGACYFNSYSPQGTDLDFTGRVPTLVPSTAPTIPQSGFPNNIIATITATGTLTSPTLSVVAPARYLR